MEHGRPGKAMRPIHICFEPATIEQLQALSEATERPVPVIVRRLVRKGLIRYAAKTERGHVA